jgi:dTDP-4-amino-4,6-dideoxygalactose transaminase
MIVDVDRYLELVRGALARGELTNSGPCAEQLEIRLKQYLNCKNVVLTSNGTSALQVAIRLLGLTGRIVTTPFTYVATANAIAWLGLEPVFVDVREDDFSLDASKLDAAIDPGASGILPVHVFGNPCRIDHIESVARAHGLPTIYDAAACFGTCYQGRSIVSFGSVSVFSFHVSKIFTTVEGGALVFHDETMYEHARALVHNGHARDLSAVHVGLNSKMSELHAAFGLVMLDEVEMRMSARAERFHRLRRRLANERGLLLPESHHDPDGNSAYFPILFNNEHAVLRTINALQKIGVDGQRHFHPALNTLPQFRSSCPLPVAEDIARRILTVQVPDASDDRLDQIALAITSGG